VLQSVDLLAGVAIGWYGTRIAGACDVAGRKAGNAEARRQGLHHASPHAVFGRIKAARSPGGALHRVQERAVWVLRMYNGKRMKPVMNTASVAGTVDTMVVGAAVCRRHAPSISAMPTDALLPTSLGNSVEGATMVLTNPMGEAGAERIMWTLLFKHP